VLAVAVRRLQIQTEQATTILHRTMDYISRPARSRQLTLIIDETPIGKVHVG
jgi:hypothetical protein